MASYLRKEDAIIGGYGYGNPTDCYHSNDGQQPYISDVYREFLHDGTRFQNQPFQTQYPLIFKIFYSSANIKHIQGVIRSHGFNAVPDFQILQQFMNDIYTDDAPYGPHNRLDPNRDNKTLGYAQYYVHRLNNQLLNRVLRNMTVMKQSRLQYLRDISGFQGPMEIERPIYTECKTSGPPLRLDFRLPFSPDGREPTAYLT